MTYKHKYLSCLLSLFLVSAPSLVSVAQNSITLEQTDKAYRLDTNTDIIITSSTPFTATGYIDIKTDDKYTQCVILKALKPSQALDWLPFIRINGVEAKDSVNCMVKIYGQGSIVVPRGYNKRPLALYAGKGQQGLLTDDLDEWTSHSLVGTNADNKAQSLRLRRGYMVCIGTQAVANSTGRFTNIGYNKIIIADKADINIDLEPAFVNKVSFVRICQWNDVDKRGFAGNDLVANEALNTTWFYDWGTADTNKRLKDREFVTQRHGRYWPDMSQVANLGTSCHVLGQNEPDHTDQANMTLDQLLAVWPELMATGKRLGAPVVASAYSSMLYPFLDSLEARGWRCDFVPLHCYYYASTSGWKSQLEGIYAKVKRPLWITEMNYGANWTGWPGSNTAASDENYQIELKNWGPTIDLLNSMSYLERYAAYNWVQDCRMLYTSKNKKFEALTPMGEYYASQTTELAYNGETPYILPKPRVYGPKDFRLSYNETTGNTTAFWTDRNGEFNNAMVVMRRRGGTLSPVDTVECKNETGGEYSFTDRHSMLGDSYCIVFELYDGSHMSSEEIINSRLDESGHQRKFYQRAGESITHKGKEYFIGGNIFTNGDFNLGAEGWTNGAETPIDKPDFQIINNGGVDGGAYLRAWNTAGTGNNTQCIGTHIPLKDQHSYFYAVSSRFNAGNNQRLRIYGPSQRPTRGKTVLQLTAKNNPVWTEETVTFDTDTCTNLFINYSWLNYTSEYDKFYCGQLFETFNEAVADGIEKAKDMIEAFKVYNRAYPVINEDLTAKAVGITTNDIVALGQIEDALLLAVSSHKAASSVDSLKRLAQQFLNLELGQEYGLDDLIAKADGATTMQDYIDAKDQLNSALGKCMKAFFSFGKIKNATFADGTGNGWEVKCGTYKDGEQNVFANVLGKPHGWSALWQNVPADNGGEATLGIRQKVQGASTGYYYLTCKATTQHYCLTDQHAYIITDTDSIVSQCLSSDRADYSLADSTAWETLVTPPVYIETGDELTIGFTSSKNGATDNSWINAQMKKSQREGWWMATDFDLRYLPVYKREMNNRDFGTICLPYAAEPAEGITIYTVSGKTENGDMVVLSPVKKMAAGVPYIFQCTDHTAFWKGNSDIVEKPVAGSRGLRGAFTGSAVNLEKGYYILEDDCLVAIDNADSYQLADNSAYLISVENLPVANAEADDALLPVSENTTLIGKPTIINESVPCYDINGRRCTPSVNGVYIQNGKKYINPNNK